MKKIILPITVAFLMLLTFSFQSVSAEEEPIYFKNMNGVELTETQYNNLRRGFSHDTINTMSQEMIDVFKDDETVTQTSSTKYVKTETRYVNGVVVSNNDTEISLNEYNNASTTPTIVYSNTATTNSNSDYVETNYKKITLTVTTGASISTKVVTLTNVWKTIPSTKSFDVLALAPGVASTSFNFNGLRSGYQKYDENIITYSQNSGNWKTVSSNTIWKKGLGLSQNIVNSTSTSLENSITVYFLCGADPFPIRGTYQHATSEVTLSQSQNYTMGTSGMGGVLIFASSVASKYDDTPGLYVNWSAWNM